MPELIDLDFRDHIIPPAETFPDTMRLHYGWSSPVRDVDGNMRAHLSFVADDDGVDMHIEAMLRFVAGTYHALGGGEGTLQLPVRLAEVERFVEDWDNQHEFGVYTFLGEIASLAHRYLAGDGDDYELFGAILNMHGYY